MSIAFSRWAVLALDDDGDTTSGNVLNLVQGDIVAEVAKWEGASVVYASSASFNATLMMRLGWAMSAQLRPGTLIFTERDLPGCFSRLLRVRSISVATSWALDGAEIQIFVVMPSPVVPQPAWLVSSVPLADTMLKVLGASQDGASQSNTSREIWLKAAARAWQETHEVSLWRLVVAGAFALKLPLVDSPSIVPVATLRSIVEAPFHSTSGKSPVGCAWEALVARIDAEMSDGAHDKSSIDLEVGRMVNLSTTDAMGRTILWWAAGTTEEDLAMRMTELLLKHGARADAVAASGGSPLHRSARQGHVGVARMLLSGGSDIASKDHAHRQPLHYGALYGHAAVVRYLLERGADPDVTDKDGMRPGNFAPISDLQLLRAFPS